MKRLLIILFCLPLLFACQKDEPFEEGQEVVLNLSVDMGDMQSAATRAMGDNVEGTPALWLVVFDSEGYLVEWTKAYDLTPSTNGPTTFKARLHATLEGRIMHFLLNYVDAAAADLQFDYGHENNIIGGLTVERNRDVYWQRVELPEGINGSTDQNGTVAKYLTKVPLVRNFSKIRVVENCEHFELVGFYVLNVPNKGTVAPFINGSFVQYYNENGADFTPKTYATLNADGYVGVMPDNDERINKHTEFTESTQLLDKDASYYLYESTYIEGNKDKTVSVLLKGKYDEKDYWYRVDLVKPDAQTGVIEYFDVLRNFAYTINITHVTAGKTSAKDAIEQPAGNNILSSLDIAHLTNVSDGTATLEVNYTDTVLISNDAVTVRYKFSDTGSGAKTNANIASVGDNDTDGCGWYLTYDGQTAPVEVNIAGSNSTDGWRNVTISVNDATITERKEVSITFFATSSTQTVLSRTVHYTLMPQQPMLVECPALVPTIVGSEFNVNILIPDGLPEAMFPLDFAIESQAAGNTSYLAQYITPANRETVSVKTGGSIVDISNLNGKKSFQYVVTLSYEDYKKAVVTERTLSNGQTMSMRLYPTLFKTNTAQSASTIYAYNRYFVLDTADFGNINLTMSVGYKYYGSSKSFSVSGDDANNITVKENGVVLTKTNNSFTTTTFASPIEVVYADSEGDISFFYEREILVCNKFAINNNNNAGLNDNTNITIEYATASKKGSVSATKKQLTDGGFESVIPGLTAPDENISIVLSYTYKYNNRTYTYKSNTINTTVGNLMNVQISGITFTQQ